MKKIISAFLVLIMILSLGSTVVFATENCNAVNGLNGITSTVQSARSNTYTTYDTSFSSNVTSSIMYMSGTSISCGLYGISNSASGASFTVTLIRVNDDGSTESYSPREVSGNSDDTTLIWTGITPGNYQFKFAKKNNGFLIFGQTIDRIQYYSA